MNIENIYTTLNEMLKDQTDYETLRKRVQSLTSNLRVCLSHNTYERSIQINKNKEVTNCPTCGSKIIVPSAPVTNNVDKKKALLLGLNYTGTQYELNGCINDVMDMSQVLINNYGFTSNNIEIMTDTTETKPTRENILNSFTNLIKNAVSGDTLMFAYSGHGTNSKDRNKDEWDGMDEMIVTLDDKIILDDEFHTIIKNNLKAGVNLFMFFDCCNSGTMMDLRYQYLDTMRGGKTVINSNYTDLAGNVVCISGCQDNQTSADAYINGRFNGALTWSFIQSTKSVLRPNWLNLLSSMRNLLKQNKYSQIAQMSSGRMLTNTSQLFL